MEKRRISVLTVLLSLCAATFAQGLKDVYKDYFLIGVAVNQRNVTNEEQQALIKQHEEEMKEDRHLRGGRRLHGDGGERFHPGNDHAGGHLRRDSVRT